MRDTPPGGSMAEPVATVPPDVSVQAAAQRMADREVSAVAVADDEGHLAGILTATDYVRLTAEGTDPTTTSVAGYMHEDVVSVSAGGPVRVVAETMANLGVRYVPVTDDDGRVVGMLTTDADHGHPDGETQSASPNGNECGTESS